MTNTRSFPPITGYMMVHNTGPDRGFSWDKNDPLFSDDWLRIPLTPIATKEEREGAQNLQGMADCMEMVRTELIEAGIIDKSVAPMFIANAVCAHIAAVKSKGAPQPELVLALPDYERRRLVIASDEVINGERVVCVAIKNPPRITNRQLDRIVV